MTKIVIISGSPRENSRSEYILKYLGTLLEKEGVDISYISIKDIPQEDLFEGGYDRPAIQQVVQQVEEAQGIIIGSPVYKASYTGVLKALIDLFPQDAFEDKVVLPIMTGGSNGHLLAIEYMLKPLINVLKGKSLKGVYFLDEEIDRTKDQPILSTALFDRTIKQLDYFQELLNRQYVAV